MTDKETKKIEAMMAEARKEYKHGARQFNSLMTRHGLHMIHRGEAIPQIYDLLDLITKIQSTEYNDNKDRLLDLQNAIYDYSATHENLTLACKLGEI